MSFRILSIALLYLLGVIFSPGTGSICAQQNQTANDEVVRLNGLVVERQKYSFVLQEADRYVRVEIPNSVPVLLRLNRPTIDLANNELRMPVSTSAPDGNPVNDETITFPLSEKVFISTRFKSLEEKTVFLASRVLNIRDFELSMTEPPLDDLAFSGRLIESSADQCRIESGVSTYTANLNRRKGLLGGFSILDLKPLETIVRVEGTMQGDRLIASRIRFDYLGLPTRHFDTGLPKVLSLGDQTSYCYHQPLVEALRGKVNVFHPPMWTGPSKQWNRLHHFLGDLRQEANGKPNWDAIVFNYGVRDQNETKENFQNNLRQAIKVLKKSKARLIWVTSTPVPNGYPAADQPVGYVQGRMKLQNEWAAEVLAAHKDIVVCDLWQLVKDRSVTDFQTWWGGKFMNFTYAESIPLGRKLAKYVMIGLMADNQDLNPPSVHRLPSDTASR